MKKQIIFFGLIILVILQATILNYFKIWQTKPDLLLLSVILVSLSDCNLGWVIFFSLLSGLGKDLFALNDFGINTLLFPVLGFALVKLSHKVSLEGRHIRAVLVFVAVILTDIAARLINLLLGDFMPLGIFLRVACWESFYTAVISYFVFGLIP